MIRQRNSTSTASSALSDPALCGKVSSPSGIPVASPTQRSITLNGRFLLQHITGVQRVAREILQALDVMAERGEIAAPRVLLPSKGELVAPPVLKAITLSRVGRHSGHTWEQLDLPRFCGPEPLLCLGNTAPLLRLYRPGRPTITMVHDLSYKYFPDAYTWSFRGMYSAVVPQVLLLSDAIVTVSHSEETQIREHFPFLKASSRLSHLQNGGISDDAARSARTETTRPASERGYGLYVGSLTRRKNAEGVLRAAIAFLREYPAMRFVVIGASAASFEGVELTVPPDVSGRLTMRGQVDDANEIYESFRGARFLLFPSFYEASPLPPVEAMTFGCPVVASRIPSLVERCGKAAMYCDPADHESIMAAIRQLMDKPILWQELSRSSRDQAAHYSWVGQTRSLLELCDAQR